MAAIATSMFDFRSLKRRTRQLSHVVYFGDCRAMRLSAAYPLELIQGLLTASAWLSLVSLPYCPAVSFSAPRP